MKLYLKQKLFGKPLFAATDADGGQRWVAERRAEDGALVLCDAAGNEAARVRVCRVNTNWFTRWRLQTTFHRAEVTGQNFSFALQQEMRGLMVTVRAEGLPWRFSGNDSFGYRFWDGKRPALRCKRHLTKDVLTIGHPEEELLCVSAAVAVALLDWAGIGEGI